MKFFLKNSECKRNKATTEILDEDSCVAPVQSHKQLVSSFVQIFQTSISSTFLVPVVDMSHQQSWHDISRVVGGLNLLTSELTHWALRGVEVVLLVYFSIHFYKLISWAWIDLDHFLWNGWVPQNPIEEKSTLVQVMAWCPTAPSHYLSLCYPWSVTIWCH